jgi:adenosylcobinamide-phosphate synthase
MDLAATFALAALALATEACFGYPQGLFRAIGHPVTWIGRLIGFTDRCFNHEDFSFAARRAMGFFALVLLVALPWGAATLLNLGLAALDLPHAVGFALTALIASSFIAQRSLDAHVLAVADALDRGLDAGRAAVAKIVGRDVAKLDEAGVARAAIESLAENFSDGITAPAFWLALGGLPLGLCYKAINTADSMIGHRTQRHEAFGFAAAKLDDLVNFFPARISALLIISAALFLRGASPRAAWRSVRCDAPGRPSPNAGWPEAAFAGALGLRLGGPRSYSGVVTADSWIGWGEAPSRQDIRRALRLYRRSCFFHFALLTSLALVIAQA